MSLFIPPAVRATNNSGVVLSGAKWYFYVTGGLVPADVYTTSARNVPHANPVVADNGGLFAPIYLDPLVTYRAILKTAAGTTIQDTDPYLGIASAADMSFDPGAAGDVSRTIEGKLRERLSVLDFIPANLHAGIAAGTATADCTDYFQAYVDYLDSLGGGTLYVPRGSYPMEGEVQSADGVSWLGEGPNEGGSVMLWDAAFIGASGAPATGIRMNSGLNGGKTQQTVFQGLALGHAAGAGTSGTTIGFYDTGSHDVVWRDCNVGGFKYGWVFDQTEDAEIQVCYANACKVGVWMTNGEETELGNTGSLGLYTNHNSVLGGGMKSCTQWGIVIDGGERHTVRGVNLNGPAAAIRAAGSVPLTLAELYIEGVVGKSPIYFNSTSYSGRVGMGGCSVTVIGCIATSPATFGFLQTVSCGNVVLIGNNIAGSGYVVKDAAGASTVVTDGNVLGALAGVIDGSPAFYSYIGEARRDVSFTWNPGSVANGAQTSVNTTVTGFGLGDFEVCTSFSLSSQGLHIWSVFDGANTLTTYASNNTGGAIDLGSGTVRVKMMAKQG